MEFDCSVSAEGKKLTCNDLGMNMNIAPSLNLKNIPFVLERIYAKMQNKVKAVLDELNALEEEGKSEFSIIVKQDNGEEVKHDMKKVGQNIELNPPLDSLSELVNKQLKLRLKFESRDRWQPQPASQPKKKMVYKGVGVDLYERVKRGGGRYKKKTRKSRRSRKSRKSRKSKRSRKSKKKTKRRRY